MINDKAIDEILSDLVKSGSDISYLEELRKNAHNEIKKDIDLKEVLKSISDEIEYISLSFLNKKNNYNTNVISGFSTGIYLPNYKYVLVGGNRSREDDKKIDFDTVFDVASITKLYTLLLTFKLEEIGLIDLNSKVSEVNPDFKGLSDYSFNDLIRLYGELRTNGWINNASSYEEAYEIFKTLYVFNDDKSIIKYNDFASMVIADTISKIVSSKLGKKMSFDEIMNEFLFKPLNIYNTMFNPKTTNISGNGYSKTYPFDTKARLFNGVNGHAGLFTSSSDLIILANSLFNSDYLTEEHISRLSSYNIEGNVKGNMGLYLKHKDGYKMTYSPSEYSDESFTSQGWTGSIASFDIKNKIHNSILVNAIINDDKDRVLNNKPKMFLESFDEYEMQLVKRIMLMYVVKKYYNKYCNYDESIEVRRVLSI